MFSSISQKELEELEKRYPRKTRVRLVKMDHPHAPAIGTLGTVKGIDATGEIIVVWDNGSTMYLDRSLDKWEIVKQKVRSKHLHLR